jgi:hypothetical protein
MVGSWLELAGWHLASREKKILDELGLIFPKNCQKWSELLWSRTSGASLIPGGDLWQVSRPGQGVTLHVTESWLGSVLYVLCQEHFVVFSSTFHREAIRVHHPKGMSFPNSSDHHPISHLCWWKDPTHTDMAFNLDECIEKLLTKQLLVEALIKGSVIPSSHLFCLANRHLSCILGRNLREN